MSRLVLLCGIAIPKRKPLMPSERDKRWRLAHPEKVRERQAKFLAKNPDYHREYYKRRKA